MKKQIKELQDYFRNQLMEGNFKLKEVQDHTCVITVDGEYDFSLWKDMKLMKDGLYTSFDARNFMLFDITQEQCLLIDSALRPLLEDHFVNVLYDQKLALYERLKKELSFTI